MSNFMKFKRRDILARKIYRLFLKKCLARMLNFKTSKSAFNYVALLWILNSKSNLELFCPSVQIVNIRFFVD